MPYQDTHDHGKQSSSFQNHYEVLALPALSDTGEVITSSTIKSAYHRALLVHHPDKSHHTTSPKSKYSVDQITQAFRVLGDPISRSIFDKQLRLTRNQSAATKYGTVGVIRPDSTSETIDLDDLSYDDEQRLWFTGCRCGQERGFVITEDQLESCASDGEALVGCAGCSLWIRVLFAVEDGG